MESLQALHEKIARILSKQAVQVVIAGGAVNTALGGRVSQDTDVFLLCERSSFPWVYGSLLLSGWTRLEARGERLEGYGWRSVWEQQDWPGVQVILDPSRTPDALLNGFDLPQHRAGLLKDGTVLDWRGSDWVKNAVEVTRTRLSRVRRALRYGYPVGSVMEQVLREVKARAPESMALECDTLTIIPPQLDWSEKGGAVSFTGWYATAEQGRRQVSFRVCGDGSVMTEHQELELCERQAGRQDPTDFERFVWNTH